MDRRLQRDGILAQAEVLQIEGHRVGHHDQPFPVPVRFRLRVHPQGAAPVEVEVEQRVPNDLVHHLEPGAWVPVVHDPADPSTVAVDLAEESAAGQAAAHERVSAQQDYTDTIQQVTGQDPNWPSGPTDVAGAMRMAQQYMEQNAELVDWAKSVGVPGMPGMPTPTPTPAPAAPAPGTDRIEQLERLAKLRDSGALTDEEFQRMKDEVLGA
jgi:Short C-terminal domain